MQARATTIKCQPRQSSRSVSYSSRAIVTSEQLRESWQKFILRGWSVFDPFKIGWVKFNPLQPSQDLILLCPYIVLQLTLTCTPLHGLWWTMDLTVFVVWLSPPSWPTLLKFTPCELRGCKNRPAPFPGRMSYTRRLNQALSVLSVSLDFFESVCCTY